VSRAACLVVSLSSLSLSLGPRRPRGALALPRWEAVHTRRQAVAKEGMLVFEDSTGASGDPEHAALDTCVAAPGEPFAAQGNRRNERQMSAEERQEARRQVCCSSCSARHPFVPCNLSLCRHRIPWDAYHAAWGPQRPLQRPPLSMAYSYKKGEGFMHVSLGLSLSLSLSPPSIPPSLPPSRCRYASGVPLAPASYTLNPKTKP
jgi:hypothetical protein